MKPLLVTSALPYANGPIHLGHLVEYIQTDIWVRYWRARGRDVTYICADDTHGTPIMLRARAEGIEPTELIARVWAEHRRDFDAFQISFDHYYTTHSTENRDLSAEVYETLCAHGHIVEREVEQPFCQSCQMFLPDRFISGTCPFCETRDQYGDACESCSKTYSPRQLLDPSCRQCSAPPSWRSSSHAFFKLSNFTEQLREWTDSDSLQPEVRHQLSEWFEAGLQDWDITRDAPYFGFEMPHRPGQYFYVWLDAPIGYMASTLSWCKRTGRDFSAYWRHDHADVVHFIGKDILYFHALFWPAMLLGSGFRVPTQIVVHGFLTVNGEKMSKTRGTFITAEHYLRSLDPTCLRYYYATKLSGSVEDLDLKLQDFRERVNADLLNKIVNIPSRTLSLLHKHFGGQLAPVDESGRALVCSVLSHGSEIASAYEHLDFARVTRISAAAASEINAYLHAAKPWDMVWTDTRRAAGICTAALNAVRLVIGFLAPIVPSLDAQFCRMFAVAPARWPTADFREEGQVGTYERLTERLLAAEVDQLLLKD